MALSGSVSAESMVRVSSSSTNSLRDLISRSSSGSTDFAFAGKLEVSIDVAGAADEFVLHGHVGLRGVCARA